MQTTQEVQIFADETSQQVCKENYREKVKDVLKAIGLKDVNVTFREHDIKQLIQSLKEREHQEENMAEFKKTVIKQIESEVKIITQVLASNNNNDIAGWSENAFTLLSKLQEAEDNLLISNILIGDLIYAILIDYLLP